MVEHPHSILLTHLEEGEVVHSTQEDLIQVDQVDLVVEQVVLTELAVMQQEHREELRVVLHQKMVGEIQVILALAY